MGTPRMSLTLSSHYEGLATGRVLTEGYVGNQADFDAMLEVGNIVGKGQSSVVRVVRRRDNGQIFACKFIDKFAGIATQRMRDEIRALMSVRHPHIVSLHGVFETERDLRLIVDYVAGGELFDRIVKRKFYSEREACLVIGSLLSAVAFLHARNIIHRDIKPENILLASEDDDTDIRLSDFGLAKIFEDPGEEFVTGGGGDSFSPPTSPKIRRQRAYTTLGTDYYIAPEVLRGDGYGKQVDLWSVGVVTYILLCGFPPFSDPSGDVGRVYARIREGLFDFPSPYWDMVSDVAKDFIRRLLTVDPDQRISAQIALNHPWFIRKAAVLDDTPLSPHHASFFRKFNSQRRPGFN